MWRIDNPVNLPSALIWPVIFALAMILLAGCGNDAWKTTDEVEIVSESKSPDGKYIVTVFSCSGGGAAGYAYTNLNLREASETLDQRDFLLGEHLWNSFSDITVNWRDSVNLEVTYRWASDHPDYKTKNERTVPKKGNVRISYVLVPTD
ncbi:MAG: DUF5412 domain-containing protein [Verrucomicrobiales bacterium]|nr:DUF5412 domain-containing protein [Verrucomicrobiales bacterium]